MKKILALFFSCFLAVMVGCAFTPASESVCNNLPEGQTSVICEAAALLEITPESAASLLKFTNTAALFSDAYTAQEALDFIDDIEAYLQDMENQGMTYSLAIAAAKYKYGTLSPEVKAGMVILEELLVAPPQIADTPFTEFDFKMLYWAIEDQRRVASLFMTQ